MPGVRGRWSCLGGPPARGRRPGWVQSLTFFKGARFGHDKHEPPLDMFVSGGPPCSLYCSYKASLLHSIQLRQLRQLRQKAHRVMKRRKLFSIFLSWHQNVSGRETWVGAPGRSKPIHSNIFVQGILRVDEHGDGRESICLSC